MENPIKEQQIIIRITNIQAFINKSNWEGIDLPSKTDDWKIFEKNSLTVGLNVLYANKKKYILLIFQNINQIMKKKLLF